MEDRQSPDLFRLFSSNSRLTPAELRIGVVQRAGRVTVAAVNDRGPRARETSAPTKKTRKECAVFYCAKKIMKKFLSGLVVGGVLGVAASALYVYKALDAYIDDEFFCCDDEDDAVAPAPCDEASAPEAP